MNQNLSLANPQGRRRALWMAILPLLLCILTPASYAQAQPTNRVTIIVLDQNNEPLTGATVLLKGTTDGAITSLEGAAVLNIPANSNVEIRFAGMRTETVNIGNRTEIRVRLEPDVLQTQEVVAVGFGTQKKINLSGAVAVAPREMLENRPVTNVLDALQGTVANLNITRNSGRASDIPSINLRGMTSIGGGQANQQPPLILVDGIPVDTEEFARMNPEDIESISVLKDPSTAAIYGSRAAFGAILVTTKEGYGATRVTYSSNYSFNWVGRLPEVVTDPVMVMEYANVMSAPWYNLYSDEQIENARRHKENPSQYPAQYVDNDGNYQNLGQTDWFDVVYKNPSFSTNQNISISGAAKDPKDRLAKYYLSADYMNAKGMLREGNDVFTRYSIRGKVSYQIRDWLDLVNNTAYTEYKDDVPTALTHYENGNFFHQVNRTRSLSTPYNVDGTYTSDGASFLGRLREGGRNVTQSNIFRTTFTAKAKVINDILTVTGDASFYKYNLHVHRWDAPVFYYTGPEKEATQLSYPTSSYARNGSGHNTTSVYNIYANYSQTFNKKHSLSATAGFNQELSKYSAFSAYRTELISSSLPSLNLAIGKDPTVGAEISDWATRGVFGRVGYIYDERYIIEFNGRYDGSSRFPKDDRFVFNPSGSASWIISKERFMESTKHIISLLKVRASYGTIGNQSWTNYGYIPTMGTGSSAILDGTRPIYVAAPGLVSASLTWETVETANFGVDMNFFKNRLQITGDYYISRTKGMLTKGETLPSVIGTAVPMTNAANLRTRGWDISVTWKDRFQLGRHPFSYDATFVIGDSKTKITKYSNPTGLLSDFYEGQTLGEMWGFVTEGFFQSEEEIRNHADQTAVTSYPETRPLAPGDLKFRDLDKSGTIDWGSSTLDDPGDRTIIGNSLPRYQYSLTLGANWAGFDLRIFLQGVGKRDYYPSTGNHYFWGMYAQPWANLMKDNLNHWTPENPDAYFPRPKSYVAELNREAGMPQTRYMQNAAYCRLKNVTIGYTFPERWLSKAGISRLRIYVSGENLLTFTKLHKSLDPEGLNNAAQVYPYSKTFSFGMNFNF